MKGAGGGAPSVVSETSTPLETIDRSVRTLAAEYGLTARETEMAVLLGRGHTLPHIAHELFISLDTARAHAKNIYRKLSIHKRQQLLDLIDGASSRSPEAPSEN